MTHADIENETRRLLLIEALKKAEARGMTAAEAMEILKEAQERVT